MIDINYSLRIAYYAALNGIGCPVFYGSVPPEINPDIYIVFRNITHNDASTVNSSDTITNITVDIHTWTNGMNNGLSADTLARDVYNRLYANSQFTLTIDGGQIVNTRLVNDVTQEPVRVNDRTYQDRSITFKHFIYQVSDIS